MSTVFLIIFITAEVIFAVFTVLRSAETPVWFKNRSFITAAETIILLVIVLIPMTHLKWRFTAAVIVLISRLIIDVIRFLSARKASKSTRGKAITVVSCFLSIVLITLCLAPAFVFTNYNGLVTTGNYEVSEVSAILVDENRTDTFENDGSKREVPIHFYYPDNVIGSFPLIVFSHGAFGYYQSNYSTYCELASHGYIVAALDHPHHAFFTNDTNGKTITVDTEFISTALSLNSSEASDEEIFTITHEWLNLRTDDIDFVLDTIKSAADNGAIDNTWYADDKEAVCAVLENIDTEKIGLIGHSLGGAASVAIGRERNDIGAVIDLDGTMLGEVKEIKNGNNNYYTEPYPVPILDFTKEIDYNEREQYKNEKGYPYVNEYVLDNAKEGKAVVFLNAEHMDFTDLPLISPMLASLLGSSDRDHEEMMNTINGIVLNWFDYYLKSEGTLDIQVNY